tara:strand:+ start:5249 stop:6040 length:792 start_codon:yes stop_codon:yes gene_type:complete
MFKLVVSGMLIGIANIIPGVSGATLAVITNQYQRLITNVATLTSLKFNRVEWGYLTSIGLAAVGGIYVFSWPLDYGLTHFNAVTLLFIIGLVLGSLEMVQLTTHQRSRKCRYISGWSLGGLVLVLAIGWLPTTGGIEWNNTVLYGLSGAVAMMAMLIPGVSGSMILVLLGTYTEVVQLIKSFDMIAMFPFALGAAIGGGATIKGIQWLIYTHAPQFESFILGAVIGSVVFIASQIHIVGNHPLSLCLALILGIGISWRLTHAR